MAEAMDDVTPHPSSQPQSQAQTKSQVLENQQDRDGENVEDDDGEEQDMDPSIMLPPGEFKQRLQILPGDTPTAASFEILEEDHTLGNVLRWVIARNPDVEFVGYTIPHPSDPKMHLRIQTFDNVNVMDVLEKGLDDLMDVCDAVTDKFVEARDKIGKED